MPHIGIFLVWRYQPRCGLKWLPGDCAVSAEGLSGNKVYLTSGFLSIKMIQYARGQATRIQKCEYCLVNWQQLRNGDLGVLFSRRI